MTERRRRVALRLNIGADSYADLVAALEDALALVVEREPATDAAAPSVVIESVTGGSALGWTLHLDDDPSWTHERYFAALKADQP